MKKPETNHVIISLGQNTQIRLDTATGCYRALSRTGWKWYEVNPENLGTEFVDLADNLSSTLRVQR